jgi:tRNA(Ile)-lysidine synthase
MLEQSSLSELKITKNLLAFSAGIDSTALLFLLLENNIKFDIAIVDYGIREQSKYEVSYAKELANRYDFKCFVHNAQKIESNFEAKARKTRYNFFEKLINEYKYEILLTAHHLGDRFEWMLMQFCKGAGCVELSGMKRKDKRKNYTLLRPLLHLDKQELLEYLHNNNIKYFTDQSNLDEKYKRNLFRHKYAKPLLKEYLSGIKKSFEYIDEDVKNLLIDVKINTIKEFAYFKSTQNKRSDIIAIDKYIKSKLHLTTAKEKELLKNEKSVVIARKFVVNQEHGFVFISPYIKVNKIDKKVKEKMRIAKIEPKLRAYLSKNEEILELIISLLS